MCFVFIKKVIPLNSVCALNGFIELFRFFFSVMASNDPAVLESSDNETKSEAGDPQPKTESGTSQFRLIQLIENLFILGMCSLESWEKALAQMKTNDIVVADPVLLQMYHILNQLLTTFSQHVYSHADFSQEKLPIFVNEEKTLPEILSILNPLLKKKAFKDKMFSFESVQKLMAAVRCIFQTDKKTKESDKKRKLVPKKSTNKSKKSKSDELSSSSSSSSSESDSESGTSSSSDSDTDDEFGKLFSNTDNKKKKHIPFVSQQFQYQTNDVRRRKITPGERGTHLIKIEITDTKDLKKCKSDKFYWQQVSKKGVFLLDVKNDDDDGKTLKTLDDILVKVGKKVSKIENVKEDTFKVDRKKKRY